ncbi:MAG: YARHG domain-containing protein [Calothrix sp. C42_A2020_038]|nr:YARHG domain-containing protein [Calothrix sp. C42_A2020_038]
MLLNNRYRVIQTLGSGGFGETFLAEDTQMPSKRRCVVKQLKPIQNNLQIRKLVEERFQREAAILEELGGASSQIPSLYAYFQANEQFYLVQEWIQGETLTRRLLRQGLWTENQVRELLIHLLPVLSYIHSKHIIHRDIKPDNIILRNNPEEGIGIQSSVPVLIDFGAVRESMGTILNSQGTPTSSIVIGTPGYMPSEQAAGRPTYSSDLYSLGMTAIYLLTGKQPYELETDVQTGEIIWYDFASHVSPILKQIIDKAIRYHPRERYLSADEMLSALQSSTDVAQTLLSIPQTPETLQLSINQTTPPVTIKSGNRNSIVVGSLVGVGLVGALVIAVVVTKPFSSSNIVGKNIQTAPTTSQAPINKSQQQSSGLPEQNIEQNKSTLPKSFYFLADSAYSNQETANKQVDKLKAAGYDQPGVFWIPDYENLSGNQLYQVYVGRFNKRNDCVDLLRKYGLQNQDAYCAFASQDASAPNDQFSFKQLSKSSNPTIASDYSWLSQRHVTDADLNGKSAFELDIMRNSIFARRGRRFNTPELQSYFENQSWYNPQYSPQEFDQANLLSDIEMRNAIYIQNYQNRTNLRFFK